MYAQSACAVWKVLYLKIIATYITDLVHSPEQIRLNKLDEYANISLAILEVLSSLFSPFFFRQVLIFMFHSDK